MVGSVVMPDLKNQKIGFAKNVANGEFSARATGKGNQKDVFVSSKVDEENQISNLESPVVIDGVCAFSPSDILQILTIVDIALSVGDSVKNIVMDIVKNARKNNKNRKD